MAILYTRSTDGSDADNGTTWALAKATIGGVSAIDAAGDTLWLSQVHAESSASVINFNGAGTNASFTKLLCGNDAAEPPTALATTATVTTTGTAAMNIGGSIFGYGINFICSGIITLNSQGTNNAQRWEQCTFQLTANGSGGQLFLAAPNNQMYRTELVNCQYKFAGIANYVYLAGDCVIRGGSIMAGSSTPITLFRFQLDRTAGNVDIIGVDFSNLASTFNFFTGGTLAAGKAVVRDCKLPASWSGLLVTSGLVGPGQRYEMYNCDGADTHERLWIEDYAGSTKSETTIVRTGGATDGTTALAWKMATSSTAKYPLIRLESGEIFVPNATVGSAITCTVEIVHDSQGAGSGSKFQDDEIWLEAVGLATSGTPLGTYYNCAKADVLAAAANQPDSTAAWTTTGLTTPVKQKLSVTFTPQERGDVILRVVMAKASKTCYICPKVTVA